MIPFRGSLKQCVSHAYNTWRFQPSQRLSIVCYPHGKYYVLHNVASLGDLLEKPKAADLRLVFSGTEQEARQFQNDSQIKLL